MTAKGKQVAIPWSSWYGDRMFPLRFPPGCRVNLCAMEDARRLTRREVQAALTNPIESPSLRELARGKKTVAIALDDISRPTRANQILGPLLAELEAGGIPRERAKIILALGAHRPLLRNDMIKKVGQSFYATVEVMNHNPYENLVDCGRSALGTPILINRYFLEADLKLSLSCVMPHEWAGFGGGAKNVIPGVAGLATIHANHRLVAGCYQKLTTICDPNELRRDIEAIARQIGLAATINVVVNSRRHTAGVFFGDVVAAHRAAVACARQVYATDIPVSQDVVILNSYPKDTDILQITNALNIFHLAGDDLLTVDGTIVISAACPEGRGFHALMDHGAPLAYVPSAVEPLFKGRRAIVFSPNLTERDLYHYFPASVRLCHRWGEVIAAIEQAKGRHWQAAVFPTAAMQVPEQESS